MAGASTRIAFTSGSENARVDDSDVGRTALDYRVNR